MRRNVKESMCHDRNGSSEINYCFPKNGLLDGLQDEHGLGPGSVFLRVFFHIHWRDMVSSSYFISSANFYCPV